MTKRIVYCSLFTAIALILHLIESALPPLLPFAPGAKMGLSNLATLIAVVVVGVPEAYLILVARCLLSSLFGGNLFSLAYSLPAGLVSLTVQVILLKTLSKHLSVVAISFCGALMHNMTQLAVASIIVKSPLINLMPLMLLASAVAGLMLGLTAYFTLKCLPKKIYIQPRDLEVK